MKKLSVLLILLLILSASGCSSEPPLDIIDIAPDETAEPLAAPAIIYPEAHEGGSIKLSMRLPKTLNPLINEDASVDEILRLVYEPLVIYDYELRPVINEAVIEHISLAQDNMSAVLNIRQGACWSDGRQIDANDVVFSLDTLKSATEMAVYKHCADSIQNCEIVTESSVKIIFNEQSQGLLYNLMFPVIPYQAQEADLLIRSYADSLPAGNGIYRFKEYTPSVELVLEASEAALRSKPYVTELRIQITKNAETDVLSFQRNIIDAVVCGLSDWSLLSGKTSVGVNPFSSAYYDFIGFNFNRTVFGEKSVRQAIALSMSVESIMRDVYINRANASPSMIPEYSYLYSKAAVLPEMSLDAANSLLYENGFRDTNGDGIYEKMFTDDSSTTEVCELSFTILYNTENEIRERIAKELKASLEKIGFSIQLRSESFEDYTELLKSRDYDIFIGGINMSRLKPDLGFMFSSGEAASGTNYCSYASGVMDGLLLQTRLALSPAEYVQAYSRLQEFITDELPIIGIAFRQKAMMTAPNIYGAENISNNGVYYGVNEWFVYE